MPSSNPVAPNAQLDGMDLNNSECREFNTDNTHNKELEIGNEEKNGGENRRGYIYIHEKRGGVLRSHWTNDLQPPRTDMTHSA